MYRSCTLAVCLFSRPEWSLSKSNRPSEPQRLQIGDIKIATATVDLSTLATGFPYIEGWYHLQDDNQRYIGQIKLSVFPKGSTMVPSDFYDNVECALEVSEGMIEVHDEAPEDTEEVSNVHEEYDDGRSMSVQLQSLMAGLDASNHALMSRGGGGRDATGVVDVFSTSSVCASSEVCDDSVEEGGGGRGGGGLGMMGLLLPGEGGGDRPFLFRLRWAVKHLKQRQKIFSIQKTQNNKNPKIKKTF